MKRPFILICNDDGIHSRGIRHLYNAIKPFADCVVAAPLVEKSGAGLSITFTKPLQIQTIHWDDEINTPAYRINGTPADCVKLAVTVLLDKKPDLIVSGINKGSNAGRNVLYSGTIGAVIEGVLKKIPGIAFSCSELTDPNFLSAEKYIYPIIDYFLKNPIEPDSFLNVNFPKKEKTIKGFKIASQGVGYCLEIPDKRLHPNGHTYYWMATDWNKEEEKNEHSDVTLLEDGYITAVPVNIGDLTCKKQFEKHKESFEKIFESI